METLTSFLQMILIIAVYISGAKSIYDFVNYLRGGKKNRADLKGLDHITLRLQDGAEVEVTAQELKVLHRVAGRLADVNQRHAHTPL